MENKEEIKVKLSTVIYIFIIVALIIALGITYYFGLVTDKKENIEDEKVTNTTENIATENETDKENIVENNKNNSNNVEVSLGEYYVKGIEVTPENNGVESIKLEENNKVEVDLPLGTSYSGKYEIVDNVVICNISKEINYEGGSNGKTTNREETLKFKIINNKQLKFYDTTDNTIKNTINKTYELKDKIQESEEKGEELIQFDTKFYYIEDIAKASKECEKVKKYVDYKYDLDGDGTKDKITMKKTNNEELLYSFQLNGKKFLEESAYDLYIVDLNEDDNRLEVIVTTYGGSDKINYKIFTKTGNKMKEVKNIIGREFRTDKKGKILCSDFAMNIVPTVYKEYYFIENGKLTINTLDMKKIQDVEFKLEQEVFYFSKKIDNFKKANLEDLKGSNIERLDKTTKCKIIKFVYDEEYNIDFIYVELSSTKKGYVTTASGWLAD